MVATIELKFNELSKTVSVQEAPILSLIELTKIASSSFNVNFGKMKVYHESTDTGNLSVVGNDQILLEILNASTKSCILRLILEEPVTKGPKEPRGPKEPKNLRQKNRNERRRRENDDWMKRRSRIGYELASKRLNEEFGTSINPNDLEIIFKKINIRPFRLVRFDVLPHGFFKKPDNEEKKTTDESEWSHVHCDESNSQSDEQEICDELNEALKIDESKESSDSEVVDDKKKKKQDKKKKIECKIMKRKLKRMQRDNMHFPPMCEMMMNRHHHHHPGMISGPPGFHFPPPPPPPPFHFKYHKHHAGRHGHHGHHGPHGQHPPHPFHPPHAFHPHHPPHEHDFTHFHPLHHYSPYFPPHFPPHCEGCSTSEDKKQSQKSKE